MWLALGVMAAAARLPWWLQRVLGRVVGLLAPHLAASRRRAAEVNLQLCFPDWDAARRKRLLDESFEALGIGLFEFIRAWWGSGAALGRGPGRPGRHHRRLRQ